MSKEDILEIDNDELLKLIKYTGIDAFVNLYQADHSYLERLYKKLGDGTRSSKNSTAKKMVKNELNQVGKQNDEQEAKSINRNLGFDLDDALKLRTVQQS